MIVNWINLFFKEVKNNGWDIIKAVDVDGEGTINAFAVKEAKKVPVGWAFFENWSGNIVRVRIGNNKNECRESVMDSWVDIRTNEFKEWIKSSLEKE